MQMRMNDIGPLFEGGLERQDYEFEIGQHFTFLRPGLGALIATNGRNSTYIKARKVSAQGISAEDILSAAGLDRPQNAEHPYVAAAVRKERGWRDVKNFQTRVIRLAQPGYSGRVQCAPILTQPGSGFRSSQGPPLQVLRSHSTPDHPDLPKDKGQSGEKGYR